MAGFKIPGTGIEFNFRFADEDLDVLANLDPRVCLVIGKTMQDLQDVLDSRRPEDPPMSVDSRVALDGWWSLSDETRNAICNGTLRELRKTSRN